MEVIYLLILLVAIQLVLHGMVIIYGLQLIIQEVMLPK